MCTAMEPLRRDEVVAALKRIDWTRLGAEWVILFGSLASKGVGRDIDLLAKPVYKGGGEWRLRLSTEIGEMTGVSWTRIDVVEASPETPCPIVYDAWRHGIIVYEKSKGLAREWLLVRVAVCGDYALSARRLEIIKTAARAARRRWG